MNSVLNFDAKRTFLFALTIPKTARSGYFRKAQIESGYDVNSFVAFMIDEAQKILNDFKTTPTGVLGVGPDDSLVVVGPGNITKPLHFYLAGVDWSYRFGLNDIQELVEAINSEFGNQDKDPMDLISKHCAKWFRDIEQQIPEKIKAWKKEKDKIGCAAFCVLLKDEKLFEDNTDDMPRQFGLAYFKTDLRIQFKKKKEIVTHKMLLKKYFNKTRYVVPN
jgi:hypothetical protein